MGDTNINCQFTDCEFIATHTSEAVAIALLNSHVLIHNKRSDRHVKQRMPTIDRPEIKRDVTGEDWYSFIAEWGRFKKCTEMDHDDVADQLFQCCEQPLRRLLLKENPEIIDLGEQSLLAAIKNMAVIQIATSVRRTNLLASQQDHGQSCREFYANVRAAASTCEFEVKCPHDCCEEKALVDYTSLVVKDILIAGITDTEIYKDVLNISDLSKKTDRDILRFVEEKEIARDACHSETSRHQHSADAAPAKPTFNFGLPTKAPPLSTCTASETKPHSSAPSYSFGQNSTLTEEAAREKKNAPDAETKTPSFTFGIKKEDNPTPPGSSKLPTFGASTSAGFSFANKTLSSVKPASDTAETKLQQVPSTADNPLLGRPAPVSKVASQVGFGVSGTATSQPPPYQTPLFGQQTDTSKLQEQKSAVAQTYQFPAKPPGLFQLPSSSEPSKPAAGIFGVAKQTTGAVKSATGFGFAPAANNPPQFSGFGGPTQQVNLSEPKNTEISKLGFTFTGNQISASQSSEGIFSSASSTNAAASPFGTPSSNPAFAAGSSASSTPFGNQGSSGSTGIFQPGGNINTGFGVKPASLSSSTSGNMFGSNSNTSLVFGSTVSSDAGSSISKPPFQFGTWNNETAKDIAPGFSFPGGTQQGTGFQFGASNQQSNPTPQPTFQFGATPKKPATFNAAAPNAPTSGFPFGGQSATQSNGPFQFGASTSQSNPVASGANIPFVFGNNNSSNPGGSSSNAGYNFAASQTQTPCNFSGSQSGTPQTGFSMTDVAPNQYPFSAAPSRSTTPVQQSGRRRLQARRKIRK